MAFVSNYSPEDDQQKNPAQGSVPPSGGGAGVQLAPSSGVGSAGAAPKPGQPAAGGEFATLDKYLAANQGQAEPLAGKITGAIGQQYNTLGQENQNVLQGISGQVGQGYTPADQNLLSQEASNPVSFAANPSNIQSFQKQLQDTYTGPTSAEGTPEYQAQQAKINNAIATGQAQTGSDTGRQQLLTQFEAAPSASVTGLNSAILAQNPNAQASIENAYKPFSNLVSGLSSGAGDINKQISMGQTQAQKTADQANKQISNQINALNSNVNTEYGALQNKYNTANATAANLASNLQGGTLPVGYGIDPGLQTFLNTNVAPWLKSYASGQNPIYNFANAVPTFQTNVAPTLQQAATAEEYQKAQAFQNLLAGLDLGTPTTNINPTTAAQAGTYNIAALPSINNQTLASDIEGSLLTTGVPIVDKPYFDQTAQANFLGLMAALNKYQGKPWNAPLPNSPLQFGSSSPNSFPTPTIA